VVPQRTAAVEEDGVVTEGPRRAGPHQYGTIRLGGSWRPFTAAQALAPLEGFLWPVTTHLFGLPIHGFDRHGKGAGEMRHQLRGIVPVMTAAGPDIDGSAVARHTGEIIRAPTAALAPQVSWEPLDEDRDTIFIPCGPWTFRPTVTVSPTGAVQQVTIPRWTDTGGLGWNEEPFTPSCIRSGPSTAAPFRRTPLPAGGKGTSRWDNGAFIHQTIDEVTDP
jgi:hypothetical protein